MARTISFNVDVNEGNSAKTLGELRAELEAINEELEQTEIGSKAFTELSDKARSTGSQIKALDKQLEGLEPQQTVDAFVKGFEGIAGSIAVATGTLTLFGGESELVQKAEEKLQSVIAIAVGARAAAEGLLQARIAARIVAEKAAGVATKALTVIQRVYNAVLAANPIFLLVTVIAAVTTGIYALSKALKSNTTDIEDNTDALLAQNEAYAKGQEFSLRLARARGESAIELKKRELDLADTLVEQAKLRKQQATEEEEIEKAREEFSKALQNRILLRTELIKLEKDERERIAKEEEEARQKRLEKLKKDREEEIEGLKELFYEIRRVRNEIIKENFDALGSELTKQITDADEKRFKMFEANLKRQQELARQATETSSKTSISNLQAYAELASYATEQFVESNAFQTTKELASTANSFISDLQGSLDESNEEGFEKGKKYKIAQVITTSTQAAFEAFAGAQKFNAVVPGLGVAIGTALVAAIAAKARTSIADIRNSQFGDTSAPSSGGGGGGVTLPSAQGTFTPIGQQAEGTTLTPQFDTSGAPIRAYVIGGDVADASEAQARLNRRRTLGPG